MKKLTLIITLFLILILGLKSQEYFPFPTENANWNVYLETTCDNDNPADTFILRYTIHGDTVINEILYSKLCLESGDTINPNINTIGGLRENDQKIYFVGNDFLGIPTEHELLLYDFNKKVGDTVKHDKYNSFISIIKQIDSIEISGEYRKRYKVDTKNNYHFPDEEYWIEGIGSIKNGLLGHITNTPTCGYHYWEHICFRENGIVKYLNPSFSDCLASNLFTSINQLNFESTIFLYPNPGTNKLFIENNTIWNELIVKILDRSGRILSQTSLTDSNGLIGLPDASGIYFILITNKNGQIIKTEKIIK